MTLPQTQLEAWQHIQPKLPESRRIIFQLFSRYESGLTFFELKELLGWDINRITGRVNELVHAGMVQDMGTRRINPKTGKSGIVWGLPGAGFAPVSFLEENGQVYFQ